MSTKPMPWFRAYTEMVDDEKLRLLAFEDRWHFVALLCLKGQGVLDANDALMMRKVAVKLGIDLRTLEDVARRLAEVGLIDQETLQPLAWDSRQMKSDTSAARTRAYRDRMKRHSDVTVTAQESDVTVTAQEVDTDTDKDKEKEREEYLPHVPAPEDPDDYEPLTPEPQAAPSASNQGGASKTRGTRLAADWLLPKKWGEWALQERPELTAEQVRVMADKFKDHWLAQPGKDGRKADWQATWRNWVRSERVRAGQAGGQPVGTPAGQHWAASWSGIVAKGRELGIEQGENEPPPAFKARVIAMANLSLEERSRLRADHGVTV